MGSSAVLALVSLIVGFIAVMVGLPWEGMCSS